MDEDLILENPISDDVPTNNDLFSPSQIAEEAIEPSVEDSLDVSPAKVLESESNLEVQPTEQVKVTGDSGSTKSGIDQLVLDLKDKDPIEPVINVEVNSPVKVIKTESDQPTEINNTTVNNYYNESVNPETAKNKGSDLEVSPSPIIKEVTERPGPEVTPDPTIIKKDSQVTDSLIEKILSTEKNSQVVEIRNSEQATESNSTSLLSELSKLENTVETIKTSLEAKPSDLAKDSINIDIPTVNGNQPVRLEIAGNSPESLLRILMPDQDQGQEELTRQIMDGKLLSGEAEKTRASEAKLANSVFVPSDLMIELVKNTKSESDATSTISKNITKTLESIDREKTSETFSDQMQSIMVEFDKSTKNSESSMATLSEILTQASDNKSTSNDSNSTVRSDFQKISLPNDTSDANKSTESIETEAAKDIRVSYNEKKVSTELAREILATPEMKQLKELSVVMEQVRQQMSALNETQITNNKNINNIVNSVSSVTNNDGQNISLSESKPTSEVKKEEAKTAEINSTSMAEFYLHAIYDALTSYGIKLRTY